MKKKKGFTLVELLAIIVILSIIAVITVPVVLNVIENARKSAASLSAEGYIDAIDKKVAMSFLENASYEDGEYAYDEIDVDVNGVKPTAGIYQLSSGMVSNASFCINGYTVTYRDNKVSVGEKCNVEDMKLNSLLRLSKNSTLLTYPAVDSVQILENTSGGEVTCLSSNSNVATCEIDENNIVIRSGVEEGQSTVTITSIGNSKYKDVSAAILVSTEKGLLSVTANDYEGVYDGESHGISVSSSGAMIKYGTEYGVYNLDSSPTYSDVGTYTVYYQVSKPGYTTVTSSRNVTIEGLPASGVNYGKNGQATVDDALDDLFSKTS